MGGARTTFLVSLLSKYLDFYERIHSNSESFFKCIKQFKPIKRPSKDVTILAKSRARIADFANFGFGDMKIYNK